MARPDARTLQAALFALGKRALGDHRLLAESHRARREFFGDDATERGAMPEQRFLEWFLLEHESLALATVPIEALPLDDDTEALLGSTAGVYRIETVHARGIEARDLQEDEVLELDAPAGTLLVGDLVVGRLFGGGRASWQLSAAIAVYRPGEAIAAAFRRDLERLALDRRLSQLELEHLLLSRHAVVDAPPTRRTASSAAVPTHRPPEHIEAELEAVLAAGGAPGVATELSDALLEAQRPGPVIGALLDQLAFDTAVDLEPARLLLLELWHAHHGAAPPGAVPPPAADDVAAADPDDESLGERLVRTLEQGLAEKRDLGELFRQLESMAGIDPDEEGDDPLAGDVAASSDEDGEIEDDEIEDDDGEDVADDLVDQVRAPGSVDDGDLEPLVAEFVWETGIGDSDDEHLLQLWTTLQRNAALPHVDIEQITASDLMRLLLHVWLRAAPDARAAAVRPAFAVVQRFSRWAEATQELTLRPALDTCATAFVEQLDRLQDAGLRLSSRGDLSARPALLRIEEVAHDGFGVRADEGSHWIAANARTVALLRQGDLLLASVVVAEDADRLQGPVVALPGDADALMG